MAQGRTVEELELLLRASERRAEEAEVRLRETQRQAELERFEFTEKTRLTTLDEYLVACHNLVWSRMTLEDNAKLWSKGSIPAPRDKFCPRTILPWKDFPGLQMSTMKTLMSNFPTDRHIFESRDHSAALGNHIAEWPIADEKRLESFLHTSVEAPTSKIIKYLKGLEAVQGAFAIGHGVKFENHAHALSEKSDEVVESEAALSGPRTPPPHFLKRGRLQPDQICVYEWGDAETPHRRLIYVCEYKPPHKLSPKHLRAALQPMNDVLAQVVNRSTIPDRSIDAPGHFQYCAEKLSISAMAQTYHYMIDNGLDYGLLTTGPAIVFLRIDWTNSATLYYHLAEPTHEILADPENVAGRSAVGQYLAFTLMALGRPGEQRGRSQDERLRARKGLATWTVDFDALCRSLPDSAKTPPPGSIFLPRIYHSPVDRSPYPLRMTKARVAGCRDFEVPRSMRTPSESSDDDAAPGPPNSPSLRARRARLGATKAPVSMQQRQAIERDGAEKDFERSSYDAGAEQPYCTQKCLLGLVNGHFVDPGCPNVALHCKGAAPAGKRHPVSLDEWIALLRTQLKQTLDRGITPLGLGGARGVLFRLTILEHGYTLVSKGTVRAFIKCLEHEAAVYQRLKPIQGTHVPVFLGAIDLRDLGRVYYYDHRVYVVHLSFLSWGGGPVVPEPHGKQQRLRAMAERSLRAIHQQGVVHKDVRLLNMLWSAEVDGVMIIDFERAVLVDKPRNPLGEIVSNKRRSNAVDHGKKGSSKQVRLAHIFDEDFTEARAALARY